MGCPMKNIEDRITALKVVNRVPTVGPYTVTKKTNQLTYSVTTEIWELDSAIVRFEIKGSNNHRHLGFEERGAKDIGRYLGRDERGGGGQHAGFVEVMLVDGLEPTVRPHQNCVVVIGRANIRCKAVTSSTGGRTNFYLFVKIHPDKDLKEPEFQLQISHYIGSRRMAHNVRAYGTDFNGMQVGFLPIK